MNDLRTPDHDWALERLSAFSIGMLPEDETLRLEEHILTCDACRARLAAVRTSPGTDASHLPASLIATWARSAKLLGDAERNLIESHLEACAACRATLVFAGHEPVLPPQRLTGPARVLRPAPGTWSSWNRGWARGWALGFSTAAAAAAVWLLVVQPKLLPHDAGTSATMGALSTTHVSFEVKVPTTTPDAIALLEPAAGGTSLAPATEIGPITVSAGVVLLLPAGLLASTVQDGARDVTVTLLRDGRELGSLESKLGSLGNALRVRPHPTLPAGEYLLRLTIAARASRPAEVLSFPLRVR